jgi:hypothetical protein
LLNQAAELLRASPNTFESVSCLSEIGEALEYFSVSADDLQRVLALPADLHWSPKIGTAQSIRQNYIRQYAPMLAWIARSRIAAELFGELNANLLPLDDYMMWFAQSLGDQLARMKIMRFLHDYHHVGVSRYSRNWIHTLVENNVTLCAEFADLETGIFVDDDPEEIRQTLQITSEDVMVLRQNFEQGHRRDLESARRIVSTFSTIFGSEFSFDKEIADSAFMSSYEQTLST